eukprot:TRINITY_DN6740_c0_g1_i5.p2 TRINITY_DN6740_c0_g1~~TRINITY_DN6740_c0_g1_i5.p2  ORF type:complete len:187 (-),score=28.23 TRINITY_DN6740_c0_g1_i5:61-621(-)
MTAITVVLQKRVRGLFRMKVLKVGLSAVAMTVLAACASPYDWKPMDMPAPVKTESQTQQFTVFFPWNSTRITAAGQKVVTEAAAFIKAAGTPEVTLVGTADTTGTAAINQTISERRVAVVKSALEREGVDTSGFTLRAVGDRILPVPTGPNVREQQNRRTDINVTSQVSVSVKKKKKKQKIGRAHV